MAGAALSSIGLLIAAATSVSNVFKDVASKKVLDQHEVVATTFWLRSIIATAFTVVIIVRALTGTPPAIRDGGALFGFEALHLAPLPTFLIYLFLDGLGVGCTALLYFRALQLSPLSVCIPFLAFTPVFLIPTGYVLLGELPPAVKLSGVVLVVIGSIVMHRGLFAVSLFEPVKALVREPGSRYMLLVAFIFSLTNPLDKKLVGVSDPITHSFAYGIAVLVFFAGLSLRRRSDIRTVIRTSPGWLLLAGLLDAFALLLQFTSHNYIDVVITISVKRAGIILAVLMGWLIFKERDITDKLIASSLMLAGVPIIYLPLSVGHSILFMVAALGGASFALYLTRSQKIEAEQLHAPHRTPKVNQPPPQRALKPHSLPIKTAQDV